MKRSGQLIFLCAVVAALALYGLTAPEGLPWNDSTHLALAYLGEIVRLPAMPYPVWGFHVRVFGGPVALSVSLAALAAGLLAAIVNRYFGWRFAAGAALVWIFLPGVWNRAITGQRSICLAAMAVAAAWVLNAVLLRVFRKVRSARRSAPAAAGDVLGAPSAHDESAKRDRLNRIVAWSALGASGVFALVSLTFHDYRLGEAAGVFAKGVAEAAGDRTVILNGVCDDQVVRAAGSTVSLRTDDASRAKLVAWARATFPEETNLWVAAQVGAAAFAEVATKRHPDRFYLMTGKSTTPEQWERRWEAFRPCLESSDPFVRVARRLFGYEGNAVANALLEEGEKKLESGVGVGERNLASGAATPLTGGQGTARPTSGQHDRKADVHSPTPTQNSNSPTAWRLYKRIYEEVDPGNLSALVNMSEMVRRGYAASGDEQKKLKEALEKFFADAGNRKRAREIARAAGPVRADPALLEKLSAEAKKRIAEKIAAGEKVEVDPEILSLVEWNNEMVGLMNKGELARAGRIARAILSNPKWRGFIPANAVLGSVAVSEGDYVASESFFRVATDTTNKVAAIVLNDFADTLMRLDKTDEAEKMARRAVAESDAKFWLARLTLAEVLERKGAEEAEIRQLLKAVLKHAPATVCDRVRKSHRRFVR